MQKSQFYKLCENMTDAEVVKYCKSLPPDYSEQGIDRLTILDWAERLMRDRAKLAGDYSLGLSDYELAMRYAAKHDDAARRKIPMELTFAQFKRIMHRRRCAYTGVVLLDHIGGPNAKTLERIDSSKGYTFENTVAVTDRANSLKNHLFEKPNKPMTLAELVAFTKAMRKYL